MNTVCCNNSFIFEKQQNRHWPVILQHFLYLPPLYMGVILAVFISSRCSSELAQLVPLPFSQGRSTCYSDRLHDFSVTIPRCYKDVYVNSFFSRTARLWNSTPIECFPLNYDFSGLKSRINRHHLTVGSF